MQFKADGRKPTFSVTGKVLLSDGKPAEHATVVFHPVGESGSDIVKPRGKVAAVPGGLFVPPSRLRHPPLS
jgi:hypothetical protein